MKRMKVVFSSRKGKRAMGVAVGLLFAACASATAVTVPELAYWRLNSTGRTGYSTDTTINSYVSQIPADVQQVWYTMDYVYVKSTGIPSYPVGPFNGNPAYPSNRNYTFRFTRHPAAGTTHTATGLGPIGLLVNGVPFFNPKDANSYNNQGVWHQNAIVVEGPGFDAADGHPAPVGMPQPGKLVAGSYHHHQLSPSLKDQLGGMSSAVHSPLLGFAFDGYPIYGPYAFANPDGSGGAARMTSSYRLRGITQRHTLPGGASVPASQYGPDVSAQYPLGYYTEDFEYVAGLGMLDAYNGRFTVTPQYPGGTYAYFTTVDSNGTNAYPYQIGPSYYGVLDTADTGTAGVAIPANAVRLAPWGDADGNFVVDFSDVAAIVRVASGMRDGTTATAGDVAPYPSSDARLYGDGLVSLDDAARLLRHLNGLDDGLPW